MQDNARPHVAGVCQQFLQEEGVDAMHWPARSPDLNLIEHIWDIMSHSIHQHHVAPQTVQELAEALVQVHGLIHLISIDTLCGFVVSTFNYVKKKVFSKNI
jgi:transposase